jgi:1-aminocyclopropane-1-carboxylate deaminase/D-cysteine desulfhydrase-like pyridoxal-dependent ACC family enzyme
MTAAAGAVLGLDVHLVLSGDRSATPAGNQLLAAMFGAQLHFTGAGESAWGELEIAREALTEQLDEEGAAPFTIPIGGSTPVGALGYAAGFEELRQQCAEQGLAPAAIVHTSSSGGTHAGLVAGRALARERGRMVPDVLAIGVAKGVNLGMPDIVELAGDALELTGAARALVSGDDVHVDTGWIGPDYAIPTEAGDAAIAWAARHGGWVLDRVYSGKGMAGMLGNAAAGRWPPGSDVVFIHTGGIPAVFTADGVPGAALA